MATYIWIIARHIIKREAEREREREMTYFSHEKIERKKETQTSTIFNFAKHTI